MEAAAADPKNLFEPASRTSDQAAPSKGVPDTRWNGCTSAKTSVVPEGLANKTRPRSDDAVSSPATSSVTRTVTVIVRSPVDVSTDDGVNEKSATTGGVVSPGPV